jgi:hypothetical protein
MHFEAVLERTQLTGRTETIISIVILTLLVAIGTSVFYRQSVFNPAVITATVPDRASTDEKDRLDGSPAKSIVPLPDSVIPLSAPERFDPETLSDKINGKAELYLSAGFQRLETQRFRLRDTADAWMELFLYEMGNPENAFAVYSSQQRDNSQPLDVSRFAYRTENALYWVHGSNYAELIASESSESLQQAMLAIAKSMVSGRQVEKQGVDLPSIFPTRDRIKDGVTLIPSDAFGFSRLDRVYTAEYQIPEGTFTAFLSDRGTPEKALADAEAYRSFLLEFGGRQLEPPAEVETASGLMVVEILGSYEVIFSRGRFLAGVHEAPAILPALELAKTMKSQIDAFITSQSR